MVINRAGGILLGVLVTACSGTPMNQSGNYGTKKTPAPAVDQSANSVASQQDGVPADATTDSKVQAANKFTTAELQAVDANLEQAIPLMVVAIVQNIVAKMPSPFARPPQPSTAPYAAVAPTSLTITGDKTRHLAINATVKKGAQQPSTLTMAMHLDLELVHGCLDQDSMFAKASCLMAATKTQSATDVGHTDLPGIAFKWDGNIMKVDLENPLSGTGTIDSLVYEADLPDTAARKIKGQISGDAASSFSFKVTRILVSVNFGNILSFLNPGSAVGDSAVTFDVAVVADRAQIGANISINDKADVLSMELKQPLNIAVHGQPGRRVTATLTGGIVAASLARHMSTLVNLNPDKANTLTMDIALKAGTGFDPNQIGSMVSAYGKVSAQLMLPDSSSPYKTLTCMVPQQPALSYQILIGEVVAQLGRTLETSYGWSEAKFTGAAPGAKANICSAL